MNWPVTEREAAALATAFLWSLSALAWSTAGRRVGSVPVTAIRIVLASVILLATRWVLSGSPWPSGVDGRSLLLLVASGLTGACAADLCLFRGLALIGPRQGMLVLAFSPILSALIAFLLFGERITPRGIGGILLTVGGIAWVLTRRKGSDAWPASKTDFAKGIACSFVAAVLVSFGYVFSRMGMMGRGGPAGSAALPGVAPFDGALIRVAAAAAGTMLVLPFLRSVRRTAAVFRDRKAMAVIIAGTIVGPVIGIWTSMIALKGIESGVAVALINTSPLMLIPIGYFAYEERPSWRVFLGTLVAIAGIALLVLR